LLKKLIEAFRKASTWICRLSLGESSADPLRR